MGTRRRIQKARLPVFFPMTQRAILAAALREAKASRRLRDSFIRIIESLFDVFELDPKQETLDKIREALDKVARLDAESNDNIERVLLDAEDDPGVRH